MVSRWERGFPMASATSANILIERRDPIWIRLADFGLFKVISTATGTQCGSEVYVAPEVVNHGPQTGKLDVYSLGIVIYELLGGFERLDEIDPHIKLFSPDGVKLIHDNIVKDLDRTQRGDRGNDMIKEMISLKPESRPSARECLRRYYGNDRSPAATEANRAMKAAQPKQWKVV
ncbi:MAG: camp-dependent protein kinase catalytic subunit [Peltula sp. TS41687]|nr:MAG: camp-dependent protein kinase catalytic subunit [Peltula sp. TS41687]